MVDWIETETAENLRILIEPMEHFIHAQNISTFESDLLLLKENLQRMETEEIWRSNINPRLKYGV